MNPKPTLLVCLLLLTVAASAWAAPPPKPALSDDQIFRPTVIVRNGNGQGSGTVIASIRGETLVLTAAHVVRPPGAIHVELHRFNLGVERTMSAQGWPLSLPAEVAAADPAGDVAVLRIKGRQALPYVARLAAPEDEPVKDAAVTSVGVDGGAKLQSWATRIHEVAWLDSGFTPPGVEPADQGGRPFLVTVKAPEPGRSGGALYLDNGRIVGVCVGRFEPPGGKTLGVFASPDTIRRILRDHDLDAVVARSEAARLRPTLTPTRSTRPRS